MTREKKGPQAGKSQTCRASEWQSRRRAAKFDKSPRGVKYFVTLSIGFTAHGLDQS